MCGCGDYRFFWIKSALSNQIPAVFANLHCVAMQLLKLCMLVMLSAHALRKDEDHAQIQMADFVNEEMGLMSCKIFTYIYCIST